MKQIVRVTRSSLNDIVGRSYAVDLNLSPIVFESVGATNDGEIELTPIPELQPQKVEVNGNTMTCNTATFFASAEIYATMPD